MLEIMLDVNGWQGLFDFSTGAALSTDDKPYLDFPKRISSANPYPGDLNPKTTKWTTDVALQIAKEYDPTLMLLSYANGNIVRTNTKLEEKEAKALNAEIISEAFRFADTAGYEPVIVTTGTLRHFEKIIDIDKFEGYLSVSVDPYMAGVFGATEKDLETAKELPGIRACETKEQFIKKYNIYDKFALDRTPDIILYADEDYSFTNTASRGMTLEMTPKMEKSCMAFSTLPDMPDDIFEFRSFIDKNLELGKRIAVIVVESVDFSDMPEGSKYINKYRNGIYYSEGVNFYYALLNGKEFNEVGMPYIFHNPFLKKFVSDRYPYSYIKTNLYQDPIGFNRDFKTASMGTRSGIFHSACMCDYSFECHCRALAESGMLTFINSDRLLKLN